MDAQLKKGLLEICVLKSVESADSYGYLIIKDLEKYIAISESTLYPILRNYLPIQLITIIGYENTTILPLWVL